MFFSNVINDRNRVTSGHIGTKIDLRDDRETLSALSEQGLSPLKREQGQKLANKIRAVKYMECSALTQRGLKQVRPLTSPFSRTHTHTRTIDFSRKCSVLLC